MMVRIAAAAAALALASAPVSAWEITNGKQLYTGYNLNEIIAVGSELGFQPQAQSLSDGAQVIKFTSSRAVFFAHRTVCGAATCQGLALYAEYTPDFDVALDRINAFNASQFIVSAHKSGPGAILGRYLIADFGELKGNLASDLFNFEERLSLFASAVAGGAATISAEAERRPKGAAKIHAGFSAEPSAPDHQAMIALVAHDAASGQ
jgi:hypothetical protein